VKVSDVEAGNTGTWHSWQLVLWGSSIDPSIAKPHPLPGTPEDPSTTAPPGSQPTEPPTPSPSETTEPSSGFWPWSTEHKMLWIYGAIVAIALFVLGVGVWYVMARRKARLLQTHGQGREDYEFEMLPDEGDDSVSRRLAGELYDAFAGGDEYLRESDEIESGYDGKNGRSGEGINDREMGGFLADSEDEDDDAMDEKEDQKLLKRKK
jgi:kexin